MSDLIRRQDAIDAMMALKKEDDEMYGCSIPEGFDGIRAAEALRGLPSAEQWIPFTMREPTEEEREMFPDWDFVFDCQLPESGEDVLLTDGKYVWEDTFYNDDGCYFEKADDIDFQGYAWMPMPDPYKED